MPQFLRGNLSCRVSLCTFVPKRSNFWPTNSISVSRAVSAVPQPLPVSLTRPSLSPFTAVLGRAASGQMLSAISVISSSKGKDLVGVKSMTAKKKKSSRLMCQCHATSLSMWFSWFSFTLVIILLSVWGILFLMLTSISEINIFSAALYLAPNVYLT